MRSDALLSSMPSCEAPGWVGLSLSTLPPAFGVCQSAPPDRHRASRTGPARRSPALETGFLGDEKARVDLARRVVASPWLEASWCSSIPTSGRRGRLRRCAPRRAAGLILPVRLQGRAQLYGSECLAVKSRASKPSARPSYKPSAEPAEAPCGASIPPWSDAGLQHLFASIPEVVQPRFRSNSAQHIQHLVDPGRPSSCSAARGPGR